MENRKAPFLILGSSGYLGSILSHDLAQRGHRVAGLDLYPHPDPPARNFSFHRCDIREGPALCRTVRRIAPQVIVDLAFVMKKKDLPAGDIRKINIDGRCNIVEAVRGLSSLKQFILVSSTSVYGGYPNNPSSIAETHRPRPNQYFYPKQKIRSEEIVRGATTGQGHQTTILRTTTIAGPRYPKADGLLGLFAKLPVIPSLGPSSRCLQVMHETDFVNLVERVAVDRSISGLYNLAPPDKVSLGAFARTIGKKAISVPVGLVRFAARWHGRLFPSKLETGFIEMAGYPIIADGSKLSRRYNYAFQRNALQALVEGYRQAQHHRTQRRLRNRAAPARLPLSSPKTIPGH